MRNNETQVVIDMKRVSYGFDCKAHTGQESIEDDRELHTINIK